MIIRTLRIRQDEDIHQMVEDFLIFLKGYITEHRVDEIVSTSQWIGACAILF
jgi:hypothetical protein